jgi:hypothetical protein
MTELSEKDKKKVKKAVRLLFQVVVNYFKRILEKLLKQL